MRRGRPPQPRPAAESSPPWLLPASSPITLSCWPSATRKPGPSSFSARSATRWDERRVKLDPTYLLTQVPLVPLQIHSVALTPPLGTWTTICPGVQAPDGPLALLTVDSCV